jgi:preprotein translocase subunit YajC
MKKILTLLAPLAVSATLFAEEGAPAARQQSMWHTFMMIGIALVFFYMILWRPEQKRRKKMQQQRSSMKKGDRVTAMGIVGTLDRIEKETVILKMVDGSKIEVMTGAISEVKPAAEAKAAEEPQAESVS